MLRQSLKRSSVRCAKQQSWLEFTGSKTLRLRGKGLPAVQGYGRGTGDLVVNISVFIPKTLTKEEHKAIEGLRDNENFKGDKETKKSIFDKFKNYFN